VIRIGELGTTLAAISQLLVTACVVPSSPILVTLMKDAPGSSETSVLTRASRRNIPEDTILHTYYILQFRYNDEPPENASPHGVYLVAVIWAMMRNCNAALRGVATYESANSSGPRRVTGESGHYVGSCSEMFV
jgi:hypothetical protein